MDVCKYGWVWMWRCVGGGMDTFGYEGVRVWRGAVMEKCGHRVMEGCGYEGVRDREVWVNRNLSD